MEKKLILDVSKTKGFYDEALYNEVKKEVLAAQKVLNEETGAGNDFLGWLDLPVNYDKEEFARIKAAAKKIQSNSSVLVAIGIGGSYLGARAAIEFMKKHAEVQAHPDILFYNEQPERVLIDLRYLIDTNDWSKKPENIEENNRGYNLVKRLLGLSEYKGN